MAETKTVVETKTEDPIELKRRQDVHLALIMNFDPKTALVDPETGEPWVDPEEKKDDVGLDGTDMFGRSPEDLSDTNLTKIYTILDNEDKAHIVTKEALQIFPFFREIFRDVNHEDKWTLDFPNTSISLVLEYAEYHKDKKEAKVIPYDFHLDEGPDCIIPSINKQICAFDAKLVNQWDHLIFNPRCHMEDLYLIDKNNLEVSRKKVQDAISNIADSFILSNYLGCTMHEHFLAKGHPLMSLLSAKLSSFTKNATDEEEQECFFVEMKEDTRKGLEEKMKKLTEEWEKKDQEYFKDYFENEVKPIDWNKVPDIDWNKVPDINWDLIPIPPELADL